MFEANTKKWEESILERGIEQGIEKGIEKNQLEIVEKMVQNDMNDSDIRKITGMSLAKIGQIRKRCRRR
jgi:predicted transposase/invertase (TIGR01784 family)